jgi:mono/diheme cytochrome c family protein
MTMRITRALGTSLALSALLVAGAHADRSAPPASRDGAEAPVRIRMEDLHKHGGVPPGWRLTVPRGDAAAGREVFAKLECYKCHAIKGEPFPGGAKGPADTGPELTGMGSHHPADYFLESILNPNAVIVTGPGYTGPDGRSIMPDYRDSLTVADLVDLVAYLRSLTGQHGQMPASDSGQASPGHGHAGKAKPH